LKRSEEIEKKANEQVKICQEEVLRSKQQYIQLANEAKKKIEAAERATNEATKLKEEQKKIIKDAVDEENDTFRQIYSSTVAIVGIYAFLVTILTAVKSKRCISDLQAFYGMLWHGVVYYTTKLFKLATSLSGASESISHEIISTIVHWLLFGIVMLLGVAIPLAILFLGGKWVVGVYKQYCWDEISVLVALFCVAILVFFAEFMPLNCMLLLIISHVVYIAVRWYIHDYREARS